MTVVRLFKRAVETVVFGFLGLALLVLAAYGVEVFVGL